MRGSYNNNTLPSKLLFFVIWPFGAFLYAIANFRSKDSRVIYMLFALLYGVTFVFDDVDGADNGRIVAHYEYVASLPYTEIPKYLNGELEYGQAKVDSFLPFSMVILSRFSSNAHLLYVWLIFIYTFFFLAAVTLMIRMLPQKGNSLWVSVLLLFLFAVYIRFSSINGARYWTAAFIYVYAIMRFLFENKKKYLLLLIVTPFIHFSYFFGVFIVVVYWIIRKHEIYSYALLALSYLLPSLILENILNNVDLVGENQQTRILAYTGENYNEHRVTARKDRIFIISMGNIIAQNTMPILVAITRIFKTIKYDLIDKRYFIFLVVYYAMLNFVKSSYDLSDRFGELFVLLSVAFLFRLSIRNSHLLLFKIVSVVALLALSSRIILGFRIGIMTLNIELLISNVISLFFSSNVSLLDVIKNI